ncbi:MAG: hypothetical protein AVDCRST_MAG16-465, partial [uncultured Frankineae bacterium]
GAWHRRSSGWRVCRTDRSPSTSRSSTACTARCRTPSPASTRP